MNGVRLGPQPTPLLHGDKVQIGVHELLFVDERRSGSTQYVQAMNLPDAMAKARAEAKAGKATGNTGGILSFTLPFLAVTSNVSHRIDHNIVRGHNKANTCTPGGDVCAVPSGSGIAVVAAASRTPGEDVREPLNVGPGDHLLTALVLLAQTVHQLGAQDDGNAAHLTHARGELHGLGVPGRLERAPAGKLGWPGRLRWVRRTIGTPFHSAVKPISRSSSPTIRHAT